MHSSANYLIVLAGPTAVGKTALAIELAKKFNTAIVSADSRQIYQELSIGTAKPSPEQLSAVPHFLIGNHSIQELYGAGHYAEEAEKLVQELFKTHPVVILTGGSGLYIDALLNGVDAFEEIPPAVRETLNRQFEEQGLAWLQEEILKTDPEFAAKADMNNPQRLIRALEVFLQTGKKFSSFKLGKQKINNYVPIKILLNRERSELYQQINQRVDEMLAAGLEAEARQFEAFQNLNALKTVGYREWFSFFKGDITKESAIEQIKQNTRRYAKRQLTWFRNKDDFREFDIHQKKEIEDYIQSFLKK